MSQAHLSGLMGSTLDENIQGEVQKELDVVANQLLKDVLLESGFVRAISSEEEDTSVAGDADGKYLVSFDPLDGSSNIENQFIDWYYFLDHGSARRLRCKRSSNIQAAWS